MSFCGWGKGEGERMTWTDEDFIAPHQDSPDTYLWRVRFDGGRVSVIVPNGKREFTHCEPVPGLTLGIKAWTPAHLRPPLAVCTTCHPETRCSCAKYDLEWDED